MTCEDFAPLISGLLDGELDAEEQARIQAHLEQCAACALELEELAGQRELTAGLQLFAPPVEAWERFHLGVYQRIEHALGWVLLSLGLVLGGGALLLQGLQSWLSDPQIPWLARWGLPLAGFGLLILLVSIAREKFFIRRNERYREVIR
jgi:predicted anti-sigma-YlaC factor YlaD